MEEAVKRHILESFREKYHRAGKLAKGELLKEVQELLGCSGTLVESDRLFRGWLWQPLITFVRGL
jgi:hypothetical protein